MFFLLRAIIVLIGSAISAFTDFKTGLILDKITYPMIAIGIILNAVEWYLHGFEALLGLNLFGIGIIVFAVGYIAYFFGKFGGGDVKIFTAIAFLLPFLGLYPFILTTLIFSGVIASIVLGGVYSIQYAKQGIEWKKIKENFWKTIIFGIILYAYIAFLYLFELISIPGIAFLVITIFFCLLFLVFQQGIQERFFLKWISPKKLEDEEIIATEYLNKTLKQKLNLKGKAVLEEKDIMRIKKLKIKKIPVYRNLPRFGVFIFIGVVLGLIFPNFLETIF